MDMEAERERDERAKRGGVNEILRQRGREEKRGDRARDAAG